MESPGCPTHSIHRALSRSLEPLRGHTRGGGLCAVHARSAVAALRPAAAVADVGRRRRRLDGLRTRRSWGGIGRCRFGQPRKELFIRRQTRAPPEAVVRRRRGRRGLLPRWHDGRRGGRLEASRRRPLGQTRERPDALGRPLGFEAVLPHLLSVRVVRGRGPLGTGRRKGLVGRLERLLHGSRKDLAIRRVSLRCGSELVPSLVLQRWSVAKAPVHLWRLRVPRRFCVAVRRGLRRLGAAIDQALHPHASKRDLGFV